MRSSIFGQVRLERLMGRGLAVLLASATLIAGSSIALAQDESAETEALLRKGIQLRREGSDEAALAVFLEAESQSPSSVRVLLHVATAAQAASKWLMAHEYLTKAASHESDPYYQKYRAEIEEVRAAVAQRVGQFLAVGVPEGAQVTLNGSAVGTLPMQDAKTVEAGTYVLEVTKPGFYRLRRPIAVPGGVLTRETVALNEGAPPGSGLAEGGAAGGRFAPREPQEWWQSSWVTWSLLGVGVAGGVTSGVALYLRDRAAQHWNDEDRCITTDPTLSRGDTCRGVRNDIDITEQIAIVSGIAGVSFVTLGLVHWAATSPSSDEAASLEGSATVKCAPGMMNVVCAGTF